MFRFAALLADVHWSDVVFYDTAMVGCTAATNITLSSDVDKDTGNDGGEGGGAGHGRLRSEQGNDQSGVRERVGEA